MRSPPFISPTLFLLDFLPLPHPLIPSSPPSLLTAHRSKLAVGLLSGQYSHPPKDDPTPPTQPEGPSQPTAGEKEEKKPKVGSTDILFRLYNSG